jgi:hypothetical protein
VSSVLAEDSLLLVSGPSAGVSVASRIEVWHQQTPNQIATAVANASAAFNDFRVCNITPDYVVIGGVTVPGYYAAACYAGLRSGIPPHQSMTLLQVAGITDVAGIVKTFNSTQLDTMAAAGTFVIKRQSDGTVSARHAVTTSTLDLNHREETVRANTDSRSYYYVGALKPLIAKMNVTPTSLARIETMVDDLIQYLMGPATKTSNLGAQLITGSVASVTQGTQADQVVVVINENAPKPLNGITVHQLII